MAKELSGERERGKELNLGMKLALEESGFILSDKNQWININLNAIKHPNETMHCRDSFICSFKTFLVAWHSWKQQNETLIGTNLRSSIKPIMIGFFSIYVDCQLYLVSRCTDGGGSQCKNKMLYLILSFLMQFLVINGRFFVEIGKEGGGGVQHGPSISPDDERQEQYPGSWICHFDY
jgi:hypothetical protein